MDTKTLHKTKYWKIAALLLVIILAFGNIWPTSQKHADAQTQGQPSHNVAIIDSVYVINGGSFPTTTTGPIGSFTDFTFFNLSVPNVSLTALGPGGVCGPDGCDTVLLNVASYGMYCNINNLTQQQKADLVSFVNLGRKLIIYDSECMAQDYSWLPYQFTTSNPGAMGANGTLTIVEENTLSSSVPASPYFIDTFMLGNQTDAVGDMNVMTTFDPNWFLDMSGTNILGVTGPVHTYATLPLGTDIGLIIYNGLDLDYMNTSTRPDSVYPADNLAKIWLQELQQLFNPSDLPSTNPVVGIALKPDTVTLNLGTNHTVIATLTNLLGEPQAGIQVSFNIDFGPNAGTTGICSINSDCITDANGQVSFTYVGNGGIGIDQINGCFINTLGTKICSSYATAEWTLPPSITIMPPYNSCRFTGSHTDSPPSGSSKILGNGFSTSVGSCDANQGTIRYQVFAYGGTKDGYNVFRKVNLPTQQGDAWAFQYIDFTPQVTGKLQIDANITIRGKSFSAVGSGFAATIDIPGDIRDIVIDFLFKHQVSPLITILKAVTNPTVAKTTSDVRMVVSGGANGRVTAEVPGAISTFPVPGPYSMTNEFNQTIPLTLVIDAVQGQTIHVAVGASSHVETYGYSFSFARMFSDQDTTIDSVTFTQR